MDSLSHNGRQRCRVGKLAEQLKLLYHCVAGSCKWTIYNEGETQKASTLSLLQHTELHTAQTEGEENVRESSKTSVHLYEYTQ